MAPTGYGSCGLTVAMGVELFAIPSLGARDNYLHCVKTDIQFSSRTRGPMFVHGIGAVAATAVHLGFMGSCSVVRSSSFCVWGTLAATHCTF
jgi:hypothetical protein